MFRRAKATPTGPVRNILIASEGRPISDEVIDLAIDMHNVDGGHIMVLTVARLWGTSFGLPNPGLRPSKAEMEVQKQNVFSAIDRLEKAGIKADGHIVTTRHPSKSIQKQAEQQGFDAIIMGADMRRPWFFRATMWSQEPYRVLGRVQIPVHLVQSGDTPARSARTTGKGHKMASARN